MEHWTDRLSEYLDGDLSTREERAAEAHLRECAECRAVLEDLREVVRRGGALEDAPPARDLWPQIRDALGARGPRVVELRPGGGDAADRAREPRWIRMSVPQLVAAALALVFLSGAGTWALWSGLRPEGGPDGAGVVPAAIPAATASGEAREYAREIRELRGVLDEYRDRLDPATVRVLERNLAVIDRAIEESREALEADPGNDYLAEHLEGSLRRKLEFLREATSTLRAAT